MDIRKSFGSRVRTLRVQRHWTQEQLAEGAALAPNYVGRIERAEVSVSLHVAVRLSRALGVRLDHLLRAPEAASPVSEGPGQPLSADELKQIQRALAILQRLFG